MNALKTYKEGNLKPTEFALKYNIPDSTFFSWLKLEDNDPQWLNLTTEVKSISNTSVFSIEGPKSIAFDGNLLTELPQNEIMSLEYNGVVISFYFSHIETVLKALKNAEL